MNALPISLDIRGGLHSQHTYLYVHTAIHSCNGIALVCIRLHVAFFLVFQLLHHSLIAYIEAAEGPKILGGHKIVYFYLFSLFYICIMVIWVVEFSSGGYKTRKIFA